MNRLKIIGIVAVIVVFTAVAGVSYGKAQEKKLINFGWDMKNPSTIAEEIDQLQDLPFDGITIRTPWCYPFYSTGLGNGDSRVEIMKKVKWGKFTDNFIYMTAGKKVDWFDDKLWADDGDIMKNIRALAKIGAAGGCKGILFDPEFVYWGQGDNTWNYAQQARSKDKTFAEFETMVRKRGIQVINAIEEYMPNTNFLSLFWGSMSSYIQAGKKASEANDPKLFQEIIKGEHYGLVNAFLCGILDGADPSTRLIDGNEHSYYNSSAKNYAAQAKIIREDTLKFIPEDLKDKYRKQVQVGHAIYADYVSDVRARHTSATYMTPDERAKWMENNVYLALKSSDHYVWFYTELVHYLRHKGIAPEMIPAINRAKKKVASGKDLGFTMENIMAKAGREYNAAQHAVIPTAKANIPRRKGEIKIDGKLIEDTWEQTAQLGPFLNYAVARRKELYAATEARMTFDDDSLYIAFECKDPDIKAVAIPAFSDGHLFWTSGSVEITIATGPENKAYYHIKVGSNNTRWDSLTKAGFDIYGKDSYWTGEYKTAVQKGSDAWTVEIAIPWKIIGRQAPKAGEKIKANLERRTRRWDDGIQELSSWSQRRTIRCPEAEQFGTWIFE